MLVLTKIPSVKELHHGHLVLAVMLPFLGLDLHPLHLVVVVAATVIEAWVDSLRSPIAPAGLASTVIALTTSVTNI